MFYIVLGRLVTSFDLTILYSNEGLWKNGHCIMSRMNLYYLFGVFLWLLSHLSKNRNKQAGANNSIVKIIYIVNYTWYIFTSTAWLIDPYPLLIMYSKRAGLLDSSHFLHHHHFHSSRDTTTIQKLFTHTCTLLYTHFTLQPIQESCLIK